MIKYLILLIAALSLKTRLIKYLYEKKGQVGNLNQQSSMG
jgi:hypothetical protein